MQKKLHSILFAALLIASATRCGGEGTPAPYTPNEAEAGQCPSVSAMTERTQQALQAQKLQPVAPIVHKILIDDGGLRVLFPSALGLLTQVPAADILSITVDFEKGLGLARMSPHLVQVLAYFGGRSEYIEGEHYGSLDVTHRLLSECAPLATLGAARRILELEETLPSGQKVPWIEAAFEAFIAVADDPFFQELLTKVEFNDDTDAQGNILVGKDAFILLFRLISANIGAENFDANYIRELIDTVMGSQLGDEAARQKLNRALDLLERLVEENQEVFPYIQSYMSCMSDVDEKGDVPILLYDYLSIQELDFVLFMKDLNAMGTETAGINLRLVLARALAVLEESPALTRDAIFVLSRFIAPEYSRSTVPMLHDLKSQGIATELILFLRTVTRGCEP